ncbi:peptidoglycan bridge formation glycyltransferase FemA/FemB family protein [Candidatus Micrarchaeota archaeon]|nr:peptidoglycan bridge formation glycyltransferase FemA/FemB family protein [Candidatus Micrarchaeota archaeon]
MNADGIHTNAATEAPQGWDDFLKAHQGTIYQSAAYAGYVRAIGMKPRFIRCEKDGQTAAQLMVVESSRPFQLLYDQPLSGITLPLARKVFGEDRFTYGPTYADPAAARATVEDAIRRAQKTHARLSGSHSPMQPESGAVFENTGLHAKPWATFLIDLTQPLETLWQNVDKAARKLVNRTREDGVVVREAESREDLNQYLNLLNEGRRKNRLLQYAAKGNDAFFDFFVKKGYGRILLAEKDGRVLAGLGITCFNGYVNEWGAGQSQYAIDNKIYASDLIRWHIVEWGQKNGCSQYDQNGVNPDPQTDKEKGIFRFKEKWGGQLKQYATYSSA